METKLKTTCLLQELLRGCRENGKDYQNIDAYVYYSRDYLWTFYGLSKIYGPRSEKIAFGRQWWNAP